MKPKKKPKKPTKLQQYEEALKRISTLGDGLPSSAVDWVNVGKNAKGMARDSITPKCPRCGK